MPSLPEFSRAERVRRELHILGMTHSGHPLDAWGDALTCATAGLPARTSGTRPPLVRSTDLRRHTDRRVTFVGWVVMMRHAVTRRREYMKFLCLEDRHGMVEAMAFPDVYRRWGLAMAGWGAYRVVGIPKGQHGAVSLVIEQAECLPLP